jgi:hypothetical protein
MWWLLFTAVDLYVGIVVLDVMSRSGSIAAEKLPRLAVTKKMLFVVTAITMVAFLVKLWTHYRS